MPIQPNTVLGRYKVRSAIGAGGMGEVFLAKDTELERPVAIKVLLPEIARDETRVRRFIQEAKAASALNHPNILTVYEIGHFENSRFIATEYIKGETLRERLTREQPDLGEVLEIAAQIGSALNAAHRAGIVHRDIKPENIMLREDGLVKVLDFGLVKLSEKNNETVELKAETRTQINTAPGTVMGTVNYMSPEQARGKDTDERTDVWSFGVVLFEMLAGRLPFAGETTSDAIAAILTKEPPPLSEYVSDLPPEMQHVVGKTLQKDRERRYRQIKDLQADLKALQKRLEFEAELERSSPPDRQSGDKTQIYNTKISEETPGIAPNNLAENLSPIIGREKEIAEIKRLLRDENVRLVTMTGVGGTGKTRLAQAVAQELLPDFSDGVFFVELAAIANAELVASTIAQPLGVKETGGKSVLEALKDNLRECKMLLVLDNFEQVVDAAPQIAELLAAAKGLKILITSRMLLRLSKEQEFVVPPLALPSEKLFDDYPLVYASSSDKLSNYPVVYAGSSDLLNDLQSYEAVKLFIERTRNAKPNFALTVENARSVAEICTRLDGLPLAIELAAARVKILSPQAILAKLGNRLQLLTGGARDLPARRQTVRGAVAWSYDLLKEEEKRLFERLAVFVGGFTYEAAEAVVQSSSVQPNFDSSSSEKEYNEARALNIDVLDLLTSLIDKSLLVSKEQADGEMRFRMLEVVREYALDRLEAAGETEAMRRSHAAYFLRLGEEAEPHLQAAQSAEWLNRLEEEHDNLRDALRWSLEREAQNAARLASAIQLLWLNHSHLTEGRKWLKAALERSRDVASDVRFKLLNGIGLLARQQGDYETARKAYEEGLAEARAANNLRQIALSSRGLGVIAYQRGDVATARKFIEEALAIYRRLDAKFGIAASLGNLGDIKRTEGDYAAARPLIEEAIAIFRQIGNKQAVSANFINLGGVAYGEGDFAAARSHFAEALATSRELGHKSLISCCLDGFAAISGVRGESECAARLAGVAEKLREQIGYEIEPAERRFRDAYTAELKTALGETGFTNFYEQGRRMKLSEAIALCLKEDESNSEED